MSHDDEIDKELRFHIDSRIDDLVGSGVPLDQARRQARLEFGGLMQTKEAVRDLGVWLIVNGLLQDCRLAFRTLRATPVVTFVAVLSLALGIGANTAMFSLVNSLMLRALPVRDPARLVLLKSREPEGYPEWSYPFWAEIRQRPQLFEASAAWSPTARANFTVAGVTTKADGFLASGSFFDTLGVTALVGRTFSEADDQRGGAATAIGRTVTLENVPFTIVGVTPPAFFGADVGRTFDVIVPLNTEPMVSRTESRLALPGTPFLNIVARLKPDQTLDAATEGVRGVRQQILAATLPPNWPKTCQ